MKKNFNLFLIVALLFFNCSKDDSYILNIRSFPERTNDFTIWQIEQFKNISQMGYLIRTDDNKIIVIDGGSEETAELLNDFIEQLGGTINYWVITHPHHDHVGALKELIFSKSNIVIEKIVHSKLDLELISNYEPKSYEYIKNFYTALNNSGIPLYEPVIGENFEIGEGVDFNVLSIKNPDIVINLVNNSSLVFQIISKSKNILFTGDLGIEGGNEVLRNNDLSFLRSTHVQMAHHGQDGVTKEFYAAVNAKTALWPTPLWLWDNNIDAKGINTGPWKTLLVKNWMDDLRIAQNIVAGIEGTSQID
jgi:beta-lactamase superfamily II metal-dependent hydrolase